MLNRADVDILVFVCLQSKLHFAAQVALVLISPAGELILSDMDVFEVIDPFGDLSLVLVDTADTDSACTDIVLEALEVTEEVRDFGLLYSYGVKREGCLR